MMGTLTLSVQKTNAQAINFSVDISDTDIDRLAVAYGEIYFPTGLNGAAPSTTDIVTAIARGLANGMMANVETHEKAKAAAEAAAAVPSMPQFLK